VGRQFKGGGADDSFLREGGVVTAVEYEIFLDLKIVTSREYFWQKNAAVF
jgi:hypothetical protein